MADNLSAELRSYAMSRVPSRDTKPEILIRSILHRLGFRFRKNVKTLPGRPDIVLTKHWAVVFVHGCFWHQHPKCKKASRPTSNSEYWDKKLERNIHRDHETSRLLTLAGWKQIVVWTCEMKDREKLAQSLTKSITAKPKVTG